MVLSPCTAGYERVVGTKKLSRVIVHVDAEDCASDEHEVEQTEGQFAAVALRWHAACQNDVVHRQFKDAMHLLNSG